METSFPFWINDNDNTWPSMFARGCVLFLVVKCNPPRSRQISPDLEFILVRNDKDTGPLPHRDAKFNDKLDDQFFKRWEKTVEVVFLLPYLGAQNRRVLFSS